MRFYSTSLDINSKIDNPVRDQVISQLNNSSIEDADYVALVITHMEDYIFDEEEFNNIKHKPFVIFDYVEYGRDSVDINHIYGENTEQFLSFIPNKNFLSLDKALKSVTIKCYFKRELPLGLNIDTYYSIYPIEYPSLNFGDFKINTEEEYNKRPIDIFFNWGWSNQSRQALHAAFYNLSDELDYSIISNHLHLVEEKKEKPNRLLIYSCYTPHHARLNMHNLLSLQQISKISVSLNGCGVKCFRHSESSINSLMALQQNNLKWTYNWDESNSIVLPNIENKNLINAEESVFKLIKSIREKNIYNKYINCINTNKLYNQSDYVNKLILNIK
jgi:hypothetical protein